jgi:hypothetical protein
MVWYNCSKSIAPHNLELIYNISSVTYSYLICYIFISHLLHFNIWSVTYSYFICLSVIYSDLICCIFISDLLHIHISSNTYSYHYLICYIFISDWKRVRGTVKRWLYSIQSSVVCFYIQVNLVISGPLQNFELSKIRLKGSKWLSLIGNYVS